MYNSKQHACMLTCINHVRMTQSQYSKQAHPQHCPWATAAGCCTKVYYHNTSACGTEKHGLTWEEQRAVANNTPSAFVKV